MKKTTFVFVIALLACLTVLYIEANRGNGLAIAALSVGGTATLILLGGGLVLAYSYLQSEMEDRRYRRREAEKYRRSMEDYERWVAIVEQARRLPAPQQPQLPAGEQAQFAAGRQFRVEQPAQTFAAASDVPEWLRED